MVKEKKKRAFIQSNYRPVLRGIKLNKNISSLESEFFQKNKEHELNCVVVISVQDDSSQTNCFLEYIEKTNICYLYYDDFCKNWNFSYSNNVLTFHLKNGQIIKPSGIYIRPFFTNQAKLQNLCLSLVHSIEMWGGRFIGPTIDNVNNGSKAYQLITTIQEAKTQSKSKNCTIPPSYFIKGTHAPSLIQKLLKEHDSMIVKSCSGLRSRVVSEQEFMKWNYKNLSFAPVLFQKKMPGKDVRVHVLDDKMWAVQVRTKKGVDYRYVERGDYETFDLSEEQKLFCATLRQAENLRLVGIDLLVDEKGKMSCLECNPSPGWAGFHRKSKHESELVKCLYKKLIPDAT